MKRFIVTFAICLMVGKGSFAEVVISGLPTDRPLIVAHRGSSGMRPEHTVPAYELAIQQGADVIECDLAVTKDLQLICTHDSWLNETTNVHTFPEFRDRVQTYFIAGQRRTDYFTIDFTLEELQTLGKIQSRSYRDQSYNGMYPLASFDDYVAVAKNENNGRTIGIYPETKTPSFFNQYLASHNTTMEDILLQALHKYDYVQETSPCFLQSFSEISLRYMANRTKLPLIFLTAFSLTDDKLADLAKFCYGLGSSKNIIVVVNSSSNSIVKTTDFVQRAHAHGLKVHPYTFRNEDRFLVWEYGSDPYREYEQFIAIGVDGFFTDFPWSLSNYMELKNAASSISSSFLLLCTSLICLTLTLSN